MLLSHDGLGVLMRRNGRLIHAVDVVFVTTCVLDSSSRCLALPARIPPVVIFLHSSPFAPPVTKAWRQSKRRRNRIDRDLFARLCWRLVHEEFERVDEDGEQEDGREEERRAKSHWERGSMAAIDLYLFFTVWKSKGWRTAVSKRREDGNGMRCLACCCCCCFSPLARSVWASTEPQAVCVPQTEKTSLNLLFLLLLLLVKSNGLTFFFSPTPLLHFFIVSVLRSGQPVSIPVGLPFSELVDYQVARPRLGRAAETKVSLSLSALSALSIIVKT